jgi:hypothetical protein
LWAAGLSRYQIDAIRMRFRTPPALPLREFRRAEETIAP